MTMKIKICGLKHPANIQDVLALQPDYIGFIFHQASRRFVGELDPTWVAGLSGAKKTGVFVNASVQAIAETVGRYGFQAIQLHGDERPADCAALKATGAEVIKAFGIDERFDWSVLNAYETAVDYFLFDTRSAARGGTGTPFDWGLLRGNPTAKPFFLSGGIGPENLRDALRLGDSRLYALDLNSRFEREPGLKDTALLQRTLHTISDE